MRWALWCASVIGGLVLSTTLGCGSSDAPTASIPSDDAPAASPATVDRANNARRLAAQREADLFPIVEFNTSKGVFKIKLNRAKAEKTVDNFLEYVNSGFYNGTIFHQVENGFVIAAGGYTSELRRKLPRVPIRNEAHNGLKNAKGTVAMFRSPTNRDSATSQFLINLADNPDLDHKSREVPKTGAPDQYGYCVFGEITEGWEVIESIAALPVHRQDQFAALPTQTVEIQSARRLK